MRKIDLYTVESIDGYIADKNGNVSFLRGEGHEAGIDSGRLFEKFFKNIDIVVMGRHTYDNIVNENIPNNWPCAGKITYVLTSHPGESNDEIIFYHHDALQLLQDLREGCGKDIWVVGGPKVIHDAINADIVDNYYLSTVPFILGSGIRLFSDQLDNQISLDLIKSYAHDGIITSHYVKAKATKEIE